MTTRKKHTPEQVVRKLTEADWLLATGADNAEVVRQLGVSEQTYYRRSSSATSTRLDGTSTQMP